MLYWQFLRARRATTPQIPMPAYLKIFVFLLGSLLIGALVAPPIFWLGQSLAASDVSGWLAGFPFHRVLSRCLQVSVLVLLLPALRWIGLRRPSELNLRRNARAASDAVAGFAIAAGGVAALAALYVLAGWFVPTPAFAWSSLGRIVLTAGAVGAVEEIVFRGVVLGICLWNLPRRPAILVSALFFAAVHFLKPAKTEIAADAVRWWSGLAEMLNLAPGLPSPALLAFGFASLVVAGWILGAGAVRTRSLWLPFGLHAGWVFSQQSSNLFLRPSAADPAALLPWVGPNLVSGAVPTGLLPIAVLILSGAMVRLYLGNAARQSISPAA